MSKTDIERVRAGGAEQRKKSLPALLETTLEETTEVDDLFLRKIRNLIKSDSEDESFYSIHIPSMVIGTVLITIGWAMLNASGAGVHSLNSVGSRYSAEVAFLNTFLSASSSSFVSFLLKRHVVKGDHSKTPRYDVRSLCNGWLSGMAAVAAGSGVMRPWGGILTGFFNAFFYMLSCLVLKRVKFDDPMENFSVYGPTGFWAMLASVFFIPYSGILWSSPLSGNLVGN